MSVVLRSWSARATAASALIMMITLSGCSVFGHSSNSSKATELSSVDPAPSGGVSATGGATPPVSAPSATIAVPVNAPSPPAVAGYALSQSSSAVVRKFQAVSGKFNGVFAGLTVRNVTKGSEVTGTVVLLGLHPELVGNAGVEKGLLPGMMKGMAGQGAKTTTQKVSGVDVAVAATKTTNIVAWYRGGTVVLVLGSGTDPAPTLAFVKAYLAAH